MRVWVKHLESRKKEWYEGLSGMKGSIIHPHTPFLLWRFCTHIPTHPLSLLWRFCTHKPAQPSLSFVCFLLRPSSPTQQPKQRMRQKRWHRYKMKLLTTTPKANDSSGFHKHKIFYITFSSLSSFCPLSHLLLHLLHIRACVEMWCDLKSGLVTHFFYRQLDFSSEPGVANKILGNEPESCLAVAKFHSWFLHDLAIISCFERKSPIWGLSVA